MKKYKSLLAILVCICICIGFFGVMPVSAAQYDNSPLQNVYYKLNVGKKLTIGYIGGSVTNGSGADNSETDSWRALTTQWFKSAYPDATVTEKDMSIGGTGTVFALYRMERALLNLQGDVPDLVFIETAINDNYDGVSGNTLKIYMESIIKKIYAKNPKCNIIMVITGDINTMKNSHESGVPFRQEHRDIAAHYNIPVIDVGAYLYDKIFAENGNNEIDTSNNTVWKKYFKDTVHPKNEGYGVYAEKIRTYLTAELVDKNLDSNVYSNVSMPSADCMSNLITSAYDVDFSNFDFTGNSNFRTDNVTFDGITYKRLISSRMGDTFTVKFNGTHFGIWTMANSVPTKISYSIDNGTEQTLQIYRASANMKIYMLAENLTNGEHTIKITHIDANQKVEIYSLLFAGEAAMSGNVSFTVEKQDDNENIDNICEASGHEFGDWKITTVAGCVTNGEKVRACTNAGCTHKETEKIEAKGHIFEETTISKQPTCTELGTETGICKECGQKTDKPIEAKGHTWGKWKMFSEANCTDKGIQNRSCSVCDAVESRYTNLGSHKFADPIISTESTLYSKGIESGKCLYCEEATTQETVCGAVDKDTGISVSNDLGVFGEGAILKIKVLTAQDKLYQSLQTVLQGEFKAYYIAATIDNSQQQPKGSITLTLPIPTGYSIDSDVYFIDGSGKTAKLDAVINTDETAFIVETDTIGSFAIVKETVSDSTVNNAEENNFALVWIIFASVCAVVIIATIVIMIVIKKKRLV